MTQIMVMLLELQQTMGKLFHSVKSVLGASLPNVVSDAAPEPDLMHGGLADWMVALQLW